jgi:hypothetical protein
MWCIFILFSLREFLDFPTCLWVKRRALRFLLQNGDGSSLWPRWVRWPRWLRWPMCLQRSSFIGSHKLHYVNRRDWYSHFVFVKVIEVASWFRATSSPPWCRSSTDLFTFPHSPPPKDEFSSSKLLWKSKGIKRNLTFGAIRPQEVCHNISKTNHPVHQSIASTAHHSILLRLP